MASSDRYAGIAICAILLTLFYGLRVDATPTLTYGPTVAKANARLHSLRKSPRTDRAQWLKIIRTFEELSCTAPTSTQRTENLLVAGRVALELYRRTKSRGDLSRAMALLRAHDRIKNPRADHGASQRVAEASLPAPSSNLSTGAAQYGPAKTDNRPQFAAQPQSQDYRVPAGTYSSSPNPYDQSATTQDSQPEGRQSSTEAASRPIIPHGNPYWNPAPRASLDITPPLDIAASLTRAIEPIKETLAPVAEKLAPIRDKLASLNPRSWTGETKLAPKPRQAEKKQTIIVIDPGHGGVDPGAVASEGKLTEKAVTLEIAKKTKEDLEKSNPDLKVILTRSDDRFLSLEERTAIANSHNADLFISIHCNSAAEPESKGIETYYLSSACSDRAMEVAARENNMSLKKMSKVEAALLNLVLQAKTAQSSKLAESVQSSLIGGLQGRHSSSQDRHVRRAPFKVLLGAKMPAILVECAFISNLEERTKLTDPAYLDALAQGIAAGALSHLASNRAVGRAMASSSTH